MNFSSDRSWSILLQAVAGASRSLLFCLVSCFWILASLPARAIIDTNNNGLSDPWEKAYNQGFLFPNTFDPQADPDHDGWTNAQEAGAGTDPFSPNPPRGLIQPTLDMMRHPSPSLGLRLPENNTRCFTR